MRERAKEYRVILAAIALLFLVFLFVPLISLLWRSFSGEAGGFTLGGYAEIFASPAFQTALVNSLLVSSCTALISVALAFLLAYTVHFTNVRSGWKRVITLAASVPMLLPTITYGFAIIYSFGKQGLLTRLAGFQFFDVYGFWGILLGYVIYTLPIAFLLVNNAMKQIDQRYVTVSRLMQDGALRRFTTTVLRPLLGTLTIAWIQSFFLSFTDFGIPASVGGSYEVIASLLYSYMLGSIPDFAKGSIIAMVMLVPSIISILLMRYMERYDIRYQHVSQVCMPKSKARDLLCGTCSIAILIALLSVFAVIFLLPFISQWPYQITFTWSHVQAVFGDETLVSVIKNTLLMALCTSLAGTLLAYGGALVSKRSRLHHRLRHLIDSFALITNTIPGMVIGIAYLFVFTKTPLQNTLALMVLCNVVHFFSTPYLMMKETLGKMNASFETSGKLLGDTWLKTIVRVITPNALSSLIEVFAYYFVNSMVTVSAIIFIAGARTMVVTTKIKELQYFAKFNEIFVLSLFILFANLFVKLLCAAYGKRREKTYEKV